VFRQHQGRVLCEVAAEVGGVALQRRAAEAIEVAGTEQGARDLRDALEFLGSLRLRHQVAQIARGQPADNFLSLSELGNFERTQLKDAFNVVAQLQSVLAQRYR
jgi:CBS domain-containing protein